MGRAASEGVEAAARAGLLAWLEAGLRPERPGALVAEQPLALAPERVGDHVVVRRAGQFAAHALARLLPVRVANRPALVGLVGLVYTDPGFRGQGLARACVARAARRLADGGALAVLLWTDLDALYAPLGFGRAGREWILALDPARCAAARGFADGAVAVGPPAPGDWPALERLYDTRPTRAERPPGALARLAAAPDCTTRVARRAGRPVAYACAGRGADLGGCVHEWAGDPDAVLACIEALAKAGARRWLCGPGDDPAAARLREAGAEASPGDFALAWLPDPPALLAHVAGGVPALAGIRLRAEATGYVLTGGRGAVALSADQTRAWLLGPERPAAAARALVANEWLALRARLPWPLALSGFDSV